MQSKLRISYSLLKLWEAGRIEDMLAYYKHLETPTTHYMEEGKAWDKLLTESIINKKELLPEFGGDKLNNPQPQLKLECKYDDNVTLVGVLDCYDSPTLYEFKAGSSADSADYSNQMQIPLYLLLLEENKMPADKAFIVHFDQAIKKHDRTLIWNTPAQLVKATIYLRENVPAIYKFFTDEGII